MTRKYLRVEHGRVGPTTDGMGWTCYDMYVVTNQLRINTFTSQQDECYVCQFMPLTNSTNG